MNCQYQWRNMDIAIGFVIPHLVRNPFRLNENNKQLTRDLELALVLEL